MTGPPHTWGFIPSNCAAAAYAGPAAPDAPPLQSYPTLQSCLAHRNVFIFGNSVSRGFAFELMPMLGSVDLISREEQKELCPKASDVDACKATYGNATRVYPSWVLFFYGRPFQPRASVPPMPEVFGSAAISMFDVCGEEAPRDCFGGLFRAAGATVRDVLIVNVGYQYGFADPHSVPEREVLQWRIDHVRTFVALMKELFPGTVIYMTVPPTHPIGVSAMWNYARFAAFNELVMNTVLRESDALVFDLWSVARDFAGSALFADPIHIPGRLTQLAWGFLEQIICPADRFRHS